MVTVFFPFFQSRVIRIIFSFLLWLRETFGGKSIFLFFLGVFDHFSSEISIFLLRVVFASSLLFLIQNAVFSIPSNNQCIGFPDKWPGGYMFLFTNNGILFHLAKPVFHQRVCVSSKSVFPKNVTL